jgi:hypothetical protein
MRPGNEQKRGKNRLKYGFLFGTVHRDFPATARHGVVKE